MTQIFNGSAASVGKRADSDTGRSYERGSLYAEVTARVIAELEAGRLPWVQPWDSADRAGAKPLIHGRMPARKAGPGW